MSVAVAVQGQAQPSPPAPSAPEDSRRGSARIAAVGRTSKEEPVPKSHP